MPDNLMICRPLEATIRRLLAATAFENQAPAIECVVVIRGWPSAINGALSQTPEGGLRLLSPVSEPNGKTVALCEQFFEYADVLVFGVMRSVTLERGAAAAPLIVTPS